MRNDKMWSTFRWNAALNWFVQSLFILNGSMGKSTYFASAFLKCLVEAYITFVVPDSTGQFPRILSLIYLLTKSAHSRTALASQLGAFFSNANRENPLWESWHTSWLENKVGEFIIIFHFYRVNLTVRRIGHFLSVTFIGRSTWKQRWGWKPKNATKNSLLTARPFHKKNSCLPRQFFLFSRFESWDQKTPSHSLEWVREYQMFWKFAYIIYSIVHKLTIVTSYKIIRKCGAISCWPMSLKHGIPNLVNASFDKTARMVLHSSSLVLFSSYKAITG